MECLCKIEGHVHEAEQDGAKFFLFNMTFIFSESDRHTKVIGPFKTFDEAKLAGKDILNSFTEEITGVFPELVTSNEPIQFH